MFLWFGRNQHLVSDRPFRAKKVCRLIVLLPGYTFVLTSYRFATASWHCFPSNTDAKYCELSGNVCLKTSTFCNHWSTYKLATSVSKLYLILCVFHPEELSSNKNHVFVLSSLYLNTYFSWFKDFISPSGTRYIDFVYCTIAIELVEVNRL